MRIILFIALAIAAFAGEQAVTDSLKTQTKCPVSGEAIDSTVFLDAAGRRIYFADSTSREQFSKNAATLLPELLKDGVEYEKVEVNSTFNRKSSCPLQKKTQEKTASHDYHSTTPPCGTTSHKGCGAPEIPK